MKKLKNIIAVFAVIAMVVPSLTSFASAAYNDQLSYPNNAKEYYDIAQEISEQYGISVNIKSFDSEITISPEEYRKILIEKSLQISEENAYADEIKKECDNQITRNAAYDYYAQSSGTMRVSWSRGIVTPVSKVIKQLAF